MQQAPRALWTPGLDPILSSNAGMFASGGFVQASQHATFAPNLVSYAPQTAPLASYAPQTAPVAGYGLFGPQPAVAPASARAPMGFLTTAPDGKDYGYWHERGAAFQLQQPGAAYAGAQTLSPNVMAKIKDYSVNHHWRHLAKRLNPAFEEAGGGASGLNYEQLQKFYGIVGTTYFGEPLDHLLNPDIFERFDFNGDGVLEFMQAFKSLKCVLYEIFHATLGTTTKPIEFKTPEEKGYTIIKELARGGQGAAILASSEEYGQVVLKTYEKSNPNAGTIEEHIAEMEILRELQNVSHVMHAWDIFQDAKCVYCVNELMSGGDLESLRERCDKEGIPLTEEYFKSIFKQSLLGLAHIHSHGLMHCDLKEPNIMIRNKDLQKPQLAIIDFGLAHVCAGPGEAGGTPGYVPPETNERHIWYPKGDIFSLGTAFFQLLADKTPNEKLGKFGVFQEGFTGNMADIVRFTATRPLPLHLIAGTYPGVMSWLPDMCNKDKKPRPRAIALLDLPWFQAGNGEEEEEDEEDDTDAEESENEGYCFTRGACPRR